MPPGFRPQVLNDAFLAAATQARKKTPELTHKQKVRFASQQTTSSIVFLLLLLLLVATIDFIDRSVGTGLLNIICHLVLFGIV